MFRRLEPLFLSFDRIAGGSKSGLTVSPEVLQHPRTRRAFSWITGLLILEFGIGFGAVAFALILAANGTAVEIAVWIRTVVVLGITSTLFYFSWRAQRGFVWAYGRLRLFSKIFPVVTLVLAAIPGLYPLWMVTEQIVFSLVLIGVADFLDSDHMRAAFGKGIEPPPAPEEAGPDAVDAAEPD